MHPIARAGFAKQVAAYEAARPSYPDEAIAHIVSLVEALAPAAGSPGGQPLQVVDLASGTGKLTRLLAARLERASSLQAVEPVAEMRAAFADVLPSIPCHEGTARSMPFADCSVDVITIAQAFHWFANVDSVREVARVLRPGGLLVLIWNLEDADPALTGWVAPLREIYEEYEHATPQFRLGLWRNIWATEEAQRLFAVPPLQHRRFHWAMTITRDRVWQRILSKSYVACLPADEQDRLRRRVEAVMAAIPERAAGGFNYPHFTDVFWTWRRSLRPAATPKST